MFPFKKKEEILLLTTEKSVSLLFTIASVSNSPDEKIRSQVPDSLHRSQSLILCPSSLIENWYEEFLMWTPSDNVLGPIRMILSTNTLEERLQEVFSWNEEGGVLIMSYNIFRLWMQNKETKNRSKPLSDSTHAKLKKCLLQGPNIIVADEAHTLKNRDAGIAAAAGEFRSKSRIALTGSPLANNLSDYFSMLDWISPGYLGKAVEFKANYIEPIEEGLYVDSSYRERRKSLVKLQVLKEIINPKVNRADVSVLAGSLPPKVEFLITVSLSELQRVAYDTYVNSVYQQEKKGDVGTAQLWSWMSILSLCCNHPACFREKLLDRANDAGNAAHATAGTGKKDDIENSVAIPGDESVSQAGLSEDVVAKEEELFLQVPDMNAQSLSPRAQVLHKIITESIEAGDKVLVFSHRLPTLNYIELILKKSGFRYSRMDGHTPTASRQGATKRFNTGDSEKVYLVSTRAGGLGLNIPGANRVILFDFGFSPIWEEQAIGRAYRLGQRKPVFVYRFLAGGTFEEVIHNKAVFKTQLAVRVVDKKNPIRRASKSLGEYLFPMKEVKREDVSEYVGKDPKVLDKIIMDDKEGVIRRITLTETLQKEDNDKLTEEEREGVQQEIKDEHLKRTDPDAYMRLLNERRHEETMRFGSTISNTGNSYHFGSQYLQYRPGVAPYGNMNIPQANMNVHNMHYGPSPTLTHTPGYSMYGPTRPSLTLRPEPQPGPGPGPRPISQIEEREENHQGINGRTENTNTNTNTALTNGNDEKDKDKDKEKEKEKEKEEGKEDERKDEKKRRDEKLTKTVQELARNGPCSQQ